MPARTPLSVAVITRNEARNLPRCLASVAWAAERVVVDAGSTDGTREIARAAGAVVHEHAWPGFVAQKNRAIDATSQDWVLSLDADEWLTPAGAAEVLRVLAAPAADAYAFNRLSTFLGRPLRHAWNPDWQVRLFRRGAGRFAGGPVHESLRLADGVCAARLTERLQHEPYRTLSEYVERLNRYTDLAAEGLHANGARAGVGRLVGGALVAFVKQYVLKRGCLDGTRGLIVSTGAAWYVALKYAKLRELARSGTAPARSAQ